MKDWPCPKTFKILCVLLDLTGYYRKFVRNYGKIVTPLTALIKTNAFSWMPKFDHSFQALKYVMCTNLVFILLDFTKIFVLECNALGKGIAPILMQVGQPLTVTRKQLSEKHLSNQSMKMKCCLFYMQWIYDVLIHWDNASKLKLITAASSILWNKESPP